MPTKLSRTFVDECIFLSPAGMQFTQSSPILPEVWRQFGEHPDKPVELIITPFKDRSARRVADLIDRRLIKFRADLSGAERDLAQISDIPGSVCATLYFDEMINVLVPLTSWWLSSSLGHILHTSTEAELSDGIRVFLQALGEDPKTNLRDEAIGLPDATARILVLASAICWAGRSRRQTPVVGFDNVPVASVANALPRLLHMQFLEELQTEEFGDLLAYPQLPIGTDRWPRAEDAWLFRIATNRPVRPAVEHSVPATKADAATDLFDVSCSKIGWAVVDTGIDAGHIAFRAGMTQATVDDNDEPIWLPEPDRAKTRVRKILDFSRFRELTSRDVYRKGNDELLRRAIESTLAERNKRRHKPLKMTEFDDIAQELTECLRRLADDARNDRPIDWDDVELLLTCNLAETPLRPHGTHVAGIIGGRWPHEDGSPGFVCGMCPDIQLYDLRVIADRTTGLLHSKPRSGLSLNSDTEYSVLAALRYIRQLNERNNFKVIHGVNLSLSLPHDVNNYACGSTSICEECERLVDSGVVVVAAAGNLGYPSDPSGLDFEGYGFASITDPGNADKVITVGSTHKLEPHTYGISYFSSRGPTGDGRLKPDLIAPGEKIYGPEPRGGFLELSGTSMAAPHVSGAAAMLMARHSELIGRPATIKDILCRSATDVGRDKYFQGHGLLDVLRAMQQV